MAVSDTYTVLHDPHGLVDAQLPLNRAPHEMLVTIVLAWQDPNITPRDYEQIALQLTGHARALAADVQRHAAALPKNDGRGALAEVILREAAGRLSQPIQGTAHCSRTAPARTGPVRTPGPPGGRGRRPGRQRPRTRARPRTPGSRGGKRL